MNSIVHELAKNAVKYSDKIAVIADGDKITYGQLWKEVQGFCTYLKKNNIGKGDKVVVKSGHTISYVVSDFAIHLLGAIHVPTEKTLGNDGLDVIVDEMEAKAVVATADYFSDILTVDSEKVREIAVANVPEVEISEFPDTNDVADILFTTGTTGKSKGVMISHRAIVGVSENVIYGANITDDNIYLVPVPINHASGIRKIYVTIATGGTVVLLDGFMNMKKFFALIEEHNVTSILLPPSAIRILLKLGRKKLAQYSEQLDHIHTGTAPLAEADKERLCETLPNTKLYFAYGSSEAGCVSMYDYSKFKGLASCVGRPNHNANIVIVDDNRQPMEATRDNPGTISISGKMTMEGYYNEPELTAGVLENGFVYTSDLGYIDENGFVYVLGRKDDVINIGGLKIAPTEVEGVALKYPGISECACFGVTDAKGDISVKMNVVMEKGDLDYNEFRKFIAQSVEAFKIPKDVEVVDEIPKTSNGKINRKLLK